MAGKTQRGRRVNPSHEPQPTEIIAYSSGPLYCLERRCSCGAVEITGYGPYPGERGFDTLKADMRPTPLGGPYRYPATCAEIAFAKPDSIDPRGFYPPMHAKVLVPCQ